MRRTSREVRRRAGFSIALLAAATLLPAPADPPPEIASAASRPVQVVGLGDSVTAGTACDCADFVTRLSALSAEWNGTPATSSNDGVAGLTSSGLAELLENDDGVRGDVRRGDVVLITIGANDLAAERDRWPGSSCEEVCSPATLGDITANLERVISDVRSLRGLPTQILVTTYWNVFEDGDVAREALGAGYLAWSDRVTRAANTAICSAAASQGTACVDLYVPFKGTDGGGDPTGLLADDGDHPNAAGHALIAATLAARVRPVASAGS